ncbi:hypothetical protein ACFV6F_11485 [Kitasatospora phosalacinea]|uniref:hypothetical protein n=1 Tax=Kitasatospora phosalacinea TaxID=2065 RepID=UPI0036628EF3
MPNDLDWIDEIPEDWRAPAELREPTASPFVNFAIGVLSSKHSSNGIILVISELLAEKERFSTWYLSAKGNLSERRAVELAICSGNLLQPCWEAWQTYCSRRASGAGWSKDEYVQLLTVWAEAKRQFETWRS